MKQVEFVQLGVVGQSMILSVGRSGKLIYRDKDSGERAQIRHCKNEDSPFIKDQSEFAVVSPIIFQRGVFRVSPEDKVTLQFLELHPGNKKNGGKRFIQKDAEKEAKDGLFLQDLVVDLKYQAKKAESAKTGFVKLQALCSVIEGSYNRVKGKSASELRAIVNQSIDEAPMHYLNDKDEPELFNENILRQFMAIQAIDREEVEVSADGRKITWKDGKIITEVPAGRKPKQYFAEFLGTDDGILIAKELEKKL